jgi:CBS domain-containing protein
VDDLVGPPWPVTVLPDADLDEIAERLAETRHSSVVVVDEAALRGSWGRPRGHCRGIQLPIYMCTHSLPYAMPM